MKQIFTWTLTGLLFLIATTLKAQEVTTLRWKNPKGYLIIFATPGTENVTIDWGNEETTKDSGDWPRGHGIPVPDSYEQDTEYTVTITTAPGTSLLHLECFNKGLLALDVSQNSNLESLHCYDNPELSELDLSKNTLLKILICYRTNISELDLSENTLLEGLQCDYTNISELNLSKHSLLKSLYCDNTHLPFAQLLPILDYDLSGTFSYAPQSITLEVEPGDELDMEALGLYIDDVQTLYLIDEETGAGTALGETFTVPADWERGSSHTLSMWLAGGVLPKFEENPLILTLEVKAVHDITLTKQTGMKYINLSPEDKKVVDGDNFTFELELAPHYAQSKPVVMVKRGNKKPEALDPDAPGSYRYTVEEVTSDVVIWVDGMHLNRYNVVLTPAKGVIYNMPPRVWVSHWDDYSFRIDLEEGYDNSYAVVMIQQGNNEPEPLKPYTPGTNRYVIADITDHITITVEGVSPVNNAQLNGETIRLWVDGGTLTVENNGPASHLQVYTLTGSLYQQKNLSAGTTTVHLAPGVYLVRINGKTTKVVARN
ncbi:hypothetical protein M2137_000754 [Parabacteroides sp. PFB2-10]|uniref:T9SS type A sorting domain-containing protein n=1 Tax=Parabacteroides sp. PFB2-10 TaxID=1742405 RepID=UPI0024741347|nr:T9SS type A sorting domain-containing protein [Parabacteroides sp. PFB2-10]MDH6311991.1 hypothetical protein [Parabacteroides sp. PFB2-10]